MTLLAVPLATALVFGLRKVREWVLTWMRSDGDYQDMLHAWFGVCSRTQPAAGTTPEIPNARHTRSNSSSQIASGSAA